jgi:hypothetical protein
MHRRPLRAALCLAAGLLALAALSAGPAFAEEQVESFKTTLVETNAFGEAGEVAAAGTVNAPPGAESFTIETYNGLTVTVDVPIPKVFRNPNSPDDYIGLSNYPGAHHNVLSGDHVVVFGGASGSTVIATRISITYPQEPPPGLREFAAAGIVQGAPVGEAFTIETREGSIDMVEVSPSTTYVRAKPIPGEEASPPSLSDVAPGDYLGVSGAVSGSTVTATRVIISAPQAGGHPDLLTSFKLENPGAPEAAQNVIFNAPTGVFGNPRAITQCVPAEFALDQCPPNSQAGLITLHADYAGDPDYLLGTAPIFSLVPSEGETARLAFIVPVLDIPIAIPVAVRTATDYGLRFTVQDITQLTPLSSAAMTLWGFPAAPVHAPQRFPKGSPGHPTGCPEVEGTACIAKATEASIAPQPLTDNPTTCTGKALTSSLEVQTYQDPEHRSQATSAYPPILGCESEVFEPVLQASPTTNQTDSASGLDLDLKVPQFLTKAAEPSEIRAATVTLPEGFTVNPDAADGQSECREAQLNLSSEGPAECPDQSKIGTFSIGTPALPERLQGSVYLGEPVPGDQYRLFMTASGFGINSKLIGSIKPNPLTGQLTAEFPDLPQAPFEDFQLHLFSGERGLMATPTACTVYPVTAEFYPWNSSLAEHQTSQIFSLNSGPHGAECPGQVRPFHPTLEAGTANPTAGAFSNFALQVNREDGDQDLAHINFVMPPGLTADLGGVAYCSDQAIAHAAASPGRQEQAHPSCPSASEIGTSNVAAGPGIHPFHATGELYLAGPFQGAPLSLVVVTPALAGPYDYGTVVVRVALNIDPLDAHVTADSEAVPEIIGGIPLRIRQIAVNINRPNFMINPTNCSEFHTVSEGVGDQGTAVSFTSPFIAVNCQTLPFAPKMAIRQLGGRKQTKRGVDPSLDFDLRTRPGDANIRSVTVTLPNAFEVDTNHLGNLCTEKQLAEDDCAGRQAIGTITDETPQLQAPLTGGAYAVTGAGGLPHLAFVLNGQVDLVPRAETETIAGGRLRTTVPIIPDAQIGHFHLHLFGQKLGYLTNTRSLCGAHKPMIEVGLDAQNGRILNQHIALKAPCGGKAKAKRHHKRHRHD